MQYPSTSVLTTLFTPLYLRQASPAFRAVAVILGTLVLAMASRIEVPMVPVPMTMQTLAVTLVGALYGWRLGAMTVLAWLLEGAIGLPVFAAGASGVPHLLGKTGGYLFSFLPVAMLVGALAERGWNGSRAVRAFLAMLMGNALCLLLGAAWLALFIGWNKAIAFGVTPFLVGGVLKSVLGAAILKAALPGGKNSS